MKKIIKLTILLSLLVFDLSAQVGNEWIDFNKTYVKFSVVEDGFYRITPTDLTDVGVDLALIDPKTFKLYRRGVESTITVIGEEDDNFDASDYLEFYGIGNDGLDDVDIYLNGEPTNPNVSLYTDTAAYFLTWGGVNGKRISADTSVNQLESSDRVGYIAHQDFSEAYANGYYEIDFVYLSEAEQSEGFVTNGRRENVLHEYEIPLDTDLFNYKEGKYIVKLLGSFLDNTRTIDVTLTSGSNTITETTEPIVDFDVLMLEIDLPPGFLEDSLSVSFYSTSLDGDPDHFRIAYHEVDLDLSSDFTINSIPSYFSLQSEKYLDLELESTLSKVYVVSSVNDLHQVGTGTTITLNNDTDTDRNYYLREDSTQYLSVAKSEIAEFEQVDVVNDYVIISHESLLSGVNELHDFKETTLGSSRNAGVYLSGKLFNTYSYGDRSPISIRRFMEDFVDKGNPEALFLVGTGITTNYSESGLGFYRFSADQSSFGVKELVPTVGQPPSDIFFTKGLGDSSYEPYIPTGRIPAGTSQEVLDYVDKLRDHASVGLDETWTKNMLHLSGGTETSEATYFLNRVLDYKEIAEGALMGANVGVFTKQTNLAIEEYNLSEQVNEGLSVITYLGHSSPNTIEIDIGEASDPTNGYNNKGKYPVLLINGCNSASFDAYTRLENWVMAKDRGAIVGFGHTGYGYTSTLNRYTSLFYTVAFQDSSFYGGSIGEIQKETIKRYALSSPDNPLNYSQMMQWILFGDPDVKFAAPLQPDFTILNDNVTLTPGLGNDQITTGTDSIKLAFQLMNYGTVSGDSLDICIKRIYNSRNDEFNYETIRVKTPNYTDTIEVVLTNDFENSGGENVFEITVDCSGEHDEFNEDNNITTFVYDMPSNGVNLLYPYPFAILGDENVDFWIESQDKEQDTIAYIFELSRTIDFTDVVYQGEVLSSGVALFEDIAINPVQDTSVYYWRARMDNSIGDEELIWKTSSFTYINDKTGWGQFEYDQYKQNSLINLTQDEEHKELVFDSISTYLEFSVVGEEYEDNYIYNTSLIIDDRTALESLWHSGCNTGSYLAIAFDASTLLSYSVETATNYISCGPDPKSVAHFRANNGGHRNAMRQYLDSIPEGNYLLLMSTHNNQIESTTDDILDLLQEFGCYSLDSLSNGIPYVFIGRKGDSIPLYERIDTNKTAKISDSFNLEDLTNQGEMSALNIGPVLRVSEMEWSFAFEDNEEIQVDFSDSDTIVVTDTIFKLKEVFNDQVLDDTLYNFDSQFLDVNNRTLSQMNHWAICYDIAPEGVIVLDITGETSEQEEEFYQGDTFYVDLAFVNISPVDFEDSLDVVWSLTNFETGEIISETEILAPLSSLDTAYFQLALVESSFYGKTELVVTFNPQTQLEQNYFNNSFYKLYSIEQDNAAPIIEAFFDDKIPNGIMESSTSPKLDFYIVDNNQSAVKVDTSGIEMYISGPCDESFECDFERLYFSQNIVTYDYTNKAYHVQINFTDLEAGYYEIEFYGVDAVGNKNLDPYILKFFVSLESAMSFFLPYPSPFSSEMRFAYKKTGSDIPDDISIQIISATGQTVKFIDQDQIGELKTGDNLTSWSWDGTDDKGNVLPNGIYFYKVSVESDVIKHLDSPADNSFKKEWGSIMIAR